MPPEPHYQNVRQWAQDANILATSEIAYTEVASAFSQKVRSGEIGWNHVSQILPKLNQLWFGRLAVVRLTLWKLPNTSFHLHYL